MEKYEIYKSALADLKNKLGLAPAQPVRWKKYPEEFVNICNKVHNNKYSYDHINFKSQRDPIVVTCPIHGDFTQRAEDHISGHGCPRCAKNKSHTVEELQDFIRNNLDNCYDIGTAAPTNDSDKFPVKCNKCGNLFNASIESLMRYRHGCPNCANIENGLRCRSNTEDFIKKAKLVHGNTYDYSKADYIKRSIPIEIICKKHGSFWQTPDHHLSGEGCPRCRSSKGEEKIRLFLESQNIEFIAQKTFEGCRDIALLRFDFFLPAYNICIEYQGKQHFTLSGFGCTAKEFWEAAKRRDEIKRKFCMENNITLIEIPYDEFFELSKNKILDAIQKSKHQKAFKN